MLLFQKETKCIVKHTWLKDCSNSEREGLQNGQGDKIFIGDEEEKLIYQRDNSGWVVQRQS